MAYGARAMFSKAADIVYNWSMAKKKKPPKTWMLASPSQRTTKAPLAASVKADVDAKAKDLVERLKPKFIEPPPKNARFNYITDVWIKWLGGTLYFGTTYTCPFRDAISPSFEVKFARMEHVGSGHFALSYLRHTEKWVRLFPSLTADECLDAVENDCHFQLG